ncbi:LruC domain-containing protein [Amphritea japonica]|uniref:DUF4842 domain-containing protein n=1 Tax=Amphritea japonica ATCC BAA-1530 TaxID=1278309 RepID=A0A7R6SSN4_9GAMM|nr:LruC domain-containing protein [Amphritea japonica]BBB25772.1 hypothetical protein AMJAP_1177 [Amphritea japonica ATCC BAA-1530]
MNNTRAFIVLMLTSVNLFADGRGGVAQNQNVDDQASVCMTIGQTASLTGLDDFLLATTDISGQAGAKYTGGDQFYLESNGPVRVEIHSGALKNNNSVLIPKYLFDQQSPVLNTATEGGHGAEHRIDAEVMLGAISAQQAGDYSGELVLVVVPQVGGEGGCGEFSVSYPGIASYETGSSSGQWATLAFEDLYPNPGDADYNDMVLQFRVQENYNAQQQLETIHLDFIPLARGAGYNHRLYLSLDGTLDSRNATYESTPALVGDASVKVTYNNLDSGASQTSYFDQSDDVLVFHNTRSSLSGFANVYANGDLTAPRVMTSIDISLTNPELNPASQALAGGEFNYRPFLYVMNTRQDIDLSEVNPYNGMIDQNGYPFGLMVPVDWRWPLEGVSIDVAYPYFSEYRSWLAGETDNISDQAMKWFNYPSSGAEGNLIWGENSFTEGL